MSLKATATSSTVTFPDQQAIIAYINSHPMKQTGCFDKPVMQRYSIEKVAVYFANKVMIPNEIEKNVRGLLVEDIQDEETKEMAQLTIGLQSFADKCNEIDAKYGSVSSSAREIKKIYDQTKPANPMFEVPVLVYTSVLQDLIEKATYTPPKDGKGGWTKNVTDLTKEKS